MNYNIVFLLEESSIENVLNELLPKIIPPEISYICISHQGKQDLAKSIPKKLKAFKKSSRVRASQKLLTIGQFCDPLAVWAFQVIPVNQNSYEIFTFGRFLLNN